MLQYGTLLTSGISGAFAVGEAAGDIDSLLHTNGNITVVGLLFAAIVLSFYAVSKKIVVPGWVYTDACLARDAALKELKATQDELKAANQNAQRLTSVMADTVEAVNELRRMSSQKHG